MTRSRQWTLGAIAIIVVIAMAGWFLLVQGERKKAADLQLQTAQQVKTNQGQQTQIALLKAQSKKLPQMQAQLAEIQTKIPVGSEMPALIRQLSDAAQAAGVDLVDFAPQDPLSATPASNAAGGVSLPPGQLAIVNLQLGFSGNFFEIEEFMNNLEKMPRAFLVSGLHVASNEGTPVLTGTLTARVFFAPNDYPATPAIPGTTTVVTPAPAASASTAPVQ
jgi:Tfp pilus assembly protein PilO